MINSGFEKNVLKFKPSWGVVEGYFYTRPVRHILCGFACERVREGAYIWRFALPLYDHLDSLTLNFGERVANSGKLMISGQVETAAEEFVRRIGPFETETYRWQDLDVFLNRFQASRAIANPWVRRACAWTQILLGRVSDARVNLEFLCSNEGTRDYPHFLEDIEHVLSDLKNGVENARSSLLTWEAQTKRRLGVE